MASLYRTFRKYGIQPYGPGLKGALNDLLRLNPILVNVQNVHERIIGQRYGIFECEDLVPCHPSLWMEWLATDGEGYYARLAVIAQRLGSPADTSVCLDFIGEGTQIAVWCGSIIIPLDEFGHAKDEGWKFCTVDALRDGFLKTVHQSLMIACEALVTMNTQGTHVEPPWPIDTQEKNGKKKDAPPYSVWHTLHLPASVYPVNSAPSASAEAGERREHLVRAHRADYRKGAGLFGKIKQLVWVPEYTRGNPDLGTVKQSYKVK